MGHPRRAEPDSRPKTGSALPYERRLVNLRADCGERPVVADKRLSLIDPLLS